MTAAPGRAAGVSRVLIAGLFVSSGIFHFLRKELFARIVPPALPGPEALVLVSGVCEIAGGIGVLVPSLRKPAGWGLIALLLAVLPANVYMAATRRPVPGLAPAANVPAPGGAVGAVPLQFPLMALVWWSACRRQSPRDQQV